MTGASEAAGAAQNVPDLGQLIVASDRRRQARWRLIFVITWIVIFLAVLAFLAFAVGFDTALLTEYFVYIVFGGVGITIFVAIASILLAICFATMGALGRLSRSPVLNGIASFYVSLVRGTPLLLQILFIYLALPQLGLVLPELACGILEPPRVVELADPAHEVLGCPRRRCALGARGSADFARRLCGRGRAPGDAVRGLRAFALRRRRAFGLCRGRRRGPRERVRPRRGLRDRRIGHGKDRGGGGWGCGRCRGRNVGFASRTRRVIALQRGRRLRRTGFATGQGRRRRHGLRLGRWGDDDLRA